jgi:hypothetical protein
VDRGSYIAGPLEDWTDGALRLAEAQFAVLAHEGLVAPFTYSYKPRRGPQKEVTVPGEKKHTVDIGLDNMLIETVFRTEDANGVLVQKMIGVGYRLSLNGGRPVFEAVDQQMLISSRAMPAPARAGINLADGKWHHLVVELDRENGVRMYADGKELSVDGEAATRVAQGSLSNEADFTVGGGFEADGLAMDIDFLRICRGTLADAHTSIEELYAWQFDGPQHRDFAGNSRADSDYAGALVAD